MSRSALALKALTSTVTLALILSACGSESSSLPTPTPPAEVPQWNLTQSFVSVVGPDNCWIARQRARLTGLVFPNFPMTVTRSGTAIALASELFEMSYAGTMTADGFSATAGPLPAGVGACTDGSGLQFPQQPGVSNLTGRFSADDQEMTATEVNSYRLATGEPVTYTWEWKATRRN